MNSREIIMYECNICGCTYKQKEMADNCCRTKYCDCGIEIECYRVKCEKCQEKEMYDKAEKIYLKDYKYDFLYDKESGRYFEDIDILEEYYERIEYDIPNYVYACYPIEFGLDIEGMVELELGDNHYEDAFENIVDLDFIQKEVDDWCKMQNIVSWYQDCDKVIMLK